MGKRRKAWMEDEDSSEDGSEEQLDDADEQYLDPDDPDLAAERELFTNPFQTGRKRKRSQKEDATYGIWGQDDQDQPTRSRTTTKMPKFVSAGQKSTDDELVDNLAGNLPIQQAAEDEQDLEMDIESDSSDSSESEDDLAPVPGVNDKPDEAGADDNDEAETPLSFAPRGIGAGRSAATSARGGIGSSTTQTAGIGARPGLGGIGSGASRMSMAQAMAAQFNRSESAAPSTATTESAPTSSREATPSAPAQEAAAAQPRARQSFLPQQTKKPLGKLSKKEQVHFAQLSKSGSKGLKMLEKMGWKSGTGLGAEGQGIVTPVGEGQKVRERGKGLASGERSAAAIAESARMFVASFVTAFQTDAQGHRRGEDPEELERQEKQARKAAKEKVKREAWTQPKKAPKVKHEYKSYEDIIAESGATGQEGVGLLVDISGNALPTQTLSGLPGFGSADSSNLPELRHNLNLICSTTSATLGSLAREGKAIEERRQYISHEEERVKRAVTAQEHAIERLTAVSSLVQRIQEKEREVNELLNVVSAEQAGPHALLNPFMDVFDELFGVYSDEYQAMNLDEAIVGAVAPIVRRLVTHWDPLESPTFMLPELKRLRRHFLIDKPVAVSADSPNVAKAARTMTPYETLMWTIWLPKIRSSINNVWDATDPVPAITLFVSWSPMLPRFVRDNMLDQLVLPKVSKAIADWSPRRQEQGVSLSTIVFPWLEHAGEERMETLLDEAKRKVRHWLKMWRPSQGVPAGLASWRDAFATSDWDSLMLKNVLPLLGVYLRDSFVVNPRDQDLKPLEQVLEWEPLLRRSMLNGILEKGFVPKWIEALYVWLTGEPNLEQVAEWYSWWKSWFTEPVAALPAMSYGFKRGLDLMNQAMVLGDDVKYRLKRPELVFPSSSSSKTSSRASSPSSKPATATKKAPATKTSALAEEISFRSIVEEMAAAADLVVVPLGRVHEQRGQPLLRISKSVDGKSGVTVYLEDDVVWMQEKGTNDFVPVSVEDMVTAATG